MFVPGIIFFALFCLVVVLIFVVAVTHDKYDQARQDRIDASLRQLGFEPSKEEIFIPACSACEGKGYVTRSSGAMVHSSQRDHCRCRKLSNWLLSLSDKWIEEGNVEQVKELLLILRRNL